MSEQITLYDDPNRISPFCLRVEVALLEAGAPYTIHGFDVYSKPAWFAQVNPQTGKIPTITYGGPIVPPEEPSPASFKLTESLVILEFLADLFPNVHLLPSASDPTARARVRLFIDAVVRNLEAPSIQLTTLRGGDGDAASEVIDKVVAGLLKLQAMLPDPDAANGGEYAMGKEFTNADCATAPILAFLLAASTIEVPSTKDLGQSQLGSGKKLQAALEGKQLERLRRYQRALWARESVKTALDIDRFKAGMRKVLGL